MAFKRKGKKASKSDLTTSEPRQIKRTPESRIAFQNFLDEVQEKKVSLGFSTSDAISESWPSDAPRECLYRGHENSTNVLLPTLIRSAIKLGWQPVTNASFPKKVHSIEKLQELEGELFYEFLPRAQKLLPHIEDDWDVLFLMRHHGVATRLLDWSQSLGVALYFALRNIVSDPNLRARAMRGDVGEAWTQPHIWILNPIRLNSNERSWDFPGLLAPRFMDNGDESYGDYLADFEDPGMDVELPFAVLPEVLNDRLNAQRGVFTIHGDIHAPMEDMLGRDVLVKVDLPLEALPAALVFLEDSGLCESVLFPDLDALGRDLHRKYRLA